MDGCQQGGAGPCRQAVTGTLGRRNYFWFLWKSRFKSGLLQEELLILELGPQGLKVNFFFLGLHNRLHNTSLDCDSKHMMAAFFNVSTEYLLEYFN